ncbi:hypothetical protein N9162_00395 [bacterium]|nr:hypothetical protein [Akkermansiaceae bacterium]MDB4440132.1 hypothetical protein [bacterium]MDB4373928.1 hypothetical protein [Akkermansiaceae bacterium]MDB4456437.1 hypothetical protein [bacterium]MDB4492072.1 hypothetical protein [bacterium]
MNFKGTIVGGWLVAIALVACQNVADVVTPEPSPQMAKASGKSYSDLKEGHGVYMKQCAQCHEHRVPSSTTLPEWHDKVSAMSAIAGLSKVEEKSLQTYLDEFTDR